MTVLGVGIETAATMDSEPVIMVLGEPQTYTTQQKNQVDRFPISLMQSSSTIQLQTRKVQKETYKTQNTLQKLGPSKSKNSLNAYFAIKSCSRKLEIKKLLSKLNVLKIFY